MACTMRCPYKGGFTCCLLCRYSRDCDYYCENAEETDIPEECEEWVEWE